MTELDELAPDVDIDAAFTAFRHASKRRRRHRKIIRLGTATLAVVVLLGTALFVANGTHDRRTHGNEAGHPTTTTTTVARTGPRTLAVTCKGTAVYVGSQVVQAEPDGVHLRITFPPGGGNIEYTTFNPDSAGGGAGIGVLSPGPWREVWPLAPGRNVLRCANTDSPGLPQQTVQVVDPHHYWTPVRTPSCNTRAPVQPNAPYGDAPNATVRSWLATNGHAADQITVLGYPRDADRVIGVLHDGELVARVNVAQWNRPGQWRLIGGIACADYAQTPETVPR